MMYNTYKKTYLLFAGPDETMEKLASITNLIRERRKALGLDQKEMLLLIGMKQQQYQRIEAGLDMKRLERY